MNNNNSNVENRQVKNWELHETSYAVQIAKKHVSAIEVLCEVSRHTYSDIIEVRNIAKIVCHKINEYDNLKATNENLMKVSSRIEDEVIRLKEVNDKLLEALKEVVKAFPVSDYSVKKTNDFYKLVALNAASKAIYQTESKAEQQ